MYLLPVESPEQDTDRLMISTFFFHFILCVMSTWLLIFILVIKNIDMKLRSEIYRSITSF